MNKKALLNINKKQHSDSVRLLTEPLTEYQRRINIVRVEPTLTILPININPIH